MWIDLPDLPNKQQFIERIRGALGTPKAPDEMTPEERQAAPQEQQLQQQLAMRELTAKVERLEAEAKRINAQVERETTLANGQRFNDAYTQAKTGQVLQDMQNVTEEIGRM